MKQLDWCTETQLANSTSDAVFIMVVSTLWPMQLVAHAAQPVSTQPSVNQLCVRTCSVLPVLQESH